MRHNRKKIPENKSKSGRFELRLSPEEQEMLAFVSWRTGKSKADVLRFGLLGQYQLEKLRE